MLYANYTSKKKKSPFNSLIDLKVATAQVTLPPTQKHHILFPLAFSLLV